MIDDYAYIKLLSSLQLKKFSYHADYVLWKDKDITVIISRAAHSLITYHLQRLSNYSKSLIWIISNES